MLLFLSAALVALPGKSREQQAYLLSEQSKRSRLLISMRNADAFVSERFSERNYFFNRASRFQRFFVSYVSWTRFWLAARRTGKRLATMSIFTAKDLRDADAKWIRKKFSVVMERTVHELRGIPCMPLEEQPPHKDQLMFSRSFSTPVSSRAGIQQVLSIYAQRASGRLREHGLVAGVVSAWASTSRFRENEFHTAHVAVGMPTETDDPVGIAKAAFAVLPKIRPGADYVRAGVVLTGLRTKSDVTPLALFEPEYEGRRIGETLDAITNKLGPRAIGIGRGGLQGAPAWTMKREMLSRRATTHWDEMCEATA